MDKQQLLNSASGLQAVGETSANEYAKKTDLLISKINAMMSDRIDIESLIGGNNLNMMKDNHANHVRFITSILKNPNAEVLVETVLWVFRAYRSHGFTTNYWAAQLNAWIEILKQELSPASFQEVYPYYEWMLTNIPIFVILSDQKLDNPNSLH